MQCVVSDGSVRETQVTRFNDRIRIASGVLYTLLFVDTDDCKRCRDPTPRSLM